MRKAFKVKAFVLKKRKLKDKDLQVILFSKEKGKISVFAKGVQKITSRRLSHLDTGNLISALIYESNDTFYLRETNLISGFSSIKEDFKKSLEFFCVLKALEKILPERQEDKKIFEYLLKVIKQIDKNKFEQYEFIENLSKISGIERKEILEIIR